MARSVLISYIKPYHFYGAQNYSICYDTIMSELPRADKKGEFIVDDNVKVLVDSLFSTLEEAERHNDLPEHIDLTDLSLVLDNDQFDLVQRVYAIDPTIYGFKGPYVGIEAPPKDFGHIEAQPFFEKGETVMTKPHDLPIPTFKAFTTMAKAMKEDIGRPLLINSSYRTSAKQALVFLAYLRLYEYDAMQTARRVAVPGYSEHGTPSSLALDLQNIDGRPSDENPTDFEDTPEYRWLLENANRFGFHLSYPKDNRWGVTFEPWHWRHIPSQNS